MRIGSCRYFTRRAWECSTAGVGTEVEGKRKVGKEVKRKVSKEEEGEGKYSAERGVGKIDEGVSKDNSSGKRFSICSDRRKGGEDE
jgi:hypothetical protein